MHKQLPREMLNSLVHRMGGRMQKCGSFHRGLSVPTLAGPIFLKTGISLLSRLSAVRPIEKDPWFGYSPAGALRKFTLQFVFSDREDWLQRSGFSRLSRRHFVFAGNRGQRRAIARIAQPAVARADKLLFLGGGGVVFFWGFGVFFFFFFFGLGGGGGFFFGGFFFFFFFFFGGGGFWGFWGFFWGGGGGGFFFFFFFFG